MASDHSHLTIGFERNSVSAKTTPEVCQAFLDVVGAQDEGWYTIETSEGRLKIDLDEVLFVKTEDPKKGSGVGFSLSGS